ncbi:MAG: hypothetical protein JNK23_10425 [Opitutaceae bacterium]|nr:hypothetical protein [Opitutaceae bacterium]
MSAVVKQARSEFRQRLAGVRASNAAAVRLTSLGMHFVPAPDETPVLVTVEINVPRLLAVLGPRLFKSTRGVASSGKGSLRVSIATAEGHEVAGRTRAP